MPFSPLLRPRFPSRSDSLKPQALGHHAATPLITVCATVLLAACSTTPPPSVTRPSPTPERAEHSDYFKLAGEQQAQEVVLYALGLLGTNYRFGGRNPDAGLDCSGMVSYIVEQVNGARLPHNAAQIASMTRPIGVNELEPGDLVFFNTLGRKHSHMGIYLGDGQFVHAPSSGGQIRIARLDNVYFEPRIDGARTLVTRN